GRLPRHLQWAAPYPAIAKPAWSAAESPRHLPPDSHLRTPAAGPLSHPRRRDSLARPVRARWNLPTIRPWRHRVVPPTRTPAEPVQGRALTRIAGTRRTGHPPSRSRPDLATALKHCFPNSTDRPRTKGSPIRTPARGIGFPVQ